ncbi:hypothetical protein BJ138DRAFT_1019106, partial [Hygrophoropsis aurantiaca]
SERWTKRHLYLGGRISQQRRRPNSWNAFVRNKLKAANKDLAPGERYRLPGFIKANKKLLSAEYTKLTPQQKNSLEVQIMKARMEKTRIVRANPKAINRDMSASFAVMDQEWTSLCSRLGMEGFYIAVRGSIEDYSEPKIFFSEKAENALISETRTLIQDELDYILRENKVSNGNKMNYRNYEAKIVEKFGVALKGWPREFLPVRNPSRIGGREQLQKLYDDLVNEKCCWVKLSTDELEHRKKDNKMRHARGEQIYQPRKSSTKKSHASTANVEDSDSSSD